MEIFETHMKSDSNRHVTTNAYIFCESALHNQLFRKEDKNSLEKIIKEINYALSQPLTMRDGLARLLLFLPQCSMKEMAAEGDKWIRLCAGKISNQNKEFIPYLLYVIAFVLRCCHENQELFNKVSKLNASFIPTIYQAARNHKDAFDCLYEFLLLYPLQALPHKSKIEALALAALISPLSSDSIEKAVLAAKVFAALPLPGKANIGEAKGNQLGQLISLGHCAADTLFQNIRENEMYTFSRDHKLPIEVLSSVNSLKKPILRLLTSMTVLNHCLTFIKEFLDSASGDFILLSTKDIVLLIARILQVEVMTVQKNKTPEFQTLCFILPSLQLKALQLMKTFVQNDMYENFIHLIEEQVTLTLRSTSYLRNNLTKKDVIEGDWKKMIETNVSLRVISYEVLTQIVKVSKGCSEFSDKILPELLKDVKPIKGSVALKKAIRGGRVSLLNAKKKSKKKGYTVAQDIEETSLLNDITQQLVAHYIPVTESALYYIESLFLHAHHSLSLRAVRILYELLVKFLNLRSTGLFNDSKIKASLFSAISAYAMYPHPLCPPSYSLLFDALSRGRSDSDPVVSEICAKSCAALSFIMANPNNVNWSDITQLHKETEDLKKSLKQMEEELTEKRVTVGEEKHEMSGDDVQSSSDEEISEKNIEKSKTAENGLISVESENEITLGSDEDISEKEKEVTLEGAEDREKRISDIKEGVHLEENIVCEKSLNGKDLNIDLEESSVNNENLGHSMENVSVIEESSSNCGTIETRNEKEKSPLESDEDNKSSSSGMSGYESDDEEPAEVIEINSNSKSLTSTKRQLKQDEVVKKIKTNDDNFMSVTEMLSSFVDK